jgi:hypothetical protein
MLDIAFDMHTRDYGITNLSAILPPWTMEGGTKALENRLRDRRVRAELKVYPNIIVAEAQGRWDKMILFGCKAAPEYNQRSVADVAAMRGADDLDAIYDIFTVATAPNQAFFNANCDPAPPSLGAALAPGDFRCFNLRGNAGRNILIAPGTTELDFSIFKNTRIERISDKFNIQFRAEMFNLLNHANFAPPTLPDNTDIFDATGTPTGVAGLLSRTTTTAREIQFGLKIIF